MCTRNNTNPEDLLPFDLEIERIILTARRVVSLSHKINTKLDTELHSDCDHSDCVHSVDLSDSYSDSIPDSLVVFTDSCSNFANSDVMAERQADHATLKELGAPDVNYQPLCIQYPNLAANFELKSGLIHLLPKFHGLAGWLFNLKCNGAGMIQTSQEGDGKGKTRITNQTWWFLALLLVSSISSPLPELFGGC
ncbi:hypothetical protein K1719_032978 [Acacia pycnantha]|nr:hypothetical protein K1719_032978 [Acacia pycnantha]